MNDPVEYLDLDDNQLISLAPLAGLTHLRDLEASSNMLTDTAGLRHGSEAADEVERIGMGRSWEAIGGADAVVFLHDLARAGEPEYEATDAFIARQLPAEVSILNVYNKADLAGDAAVPAGGLPLSALTGQGLDVLRQALLQQAGWQAAPEGLFIARTRHVQALRRTQSHLRLAQQHAQARDTALDLLAEELRLAHRALGEITGAFSNEDLLGVIFSSFCIGK